MPDFRKCIDGALQVNIRKKNCFFPPFCIPLVFALIISSAKAVNEINSNLNKKVNPNKPNFSNPVVSTTSVGVGANSYREAQFISTAPYMSSLATRAGYGFQNDRVKAGFLFYDLDGKLKFVDNGGIVHTIKFE